MSYRKDYIKTNLEKRKPKRSVFAKPWFWICFCIALIAGLIIYLLFFFDGLQVKNVIIKGGSGGSNQTLENIVLENSVIKLFDIKNLKLSTKNILLVNGKKIEEKVLQNNPLLENAKLKKHYPNSLFLEVIERKAINRFCQDQKCYFIDISGVIFQEDLLKDNNLVVLKSVDNKKDLVIGNNVIAKDTMRQITILQKAVEGNFITKIKEILIAKSPRINIFLVDGAKIYFDLSGEDKLDSQIQKMALLLGSGELIGKNIKYIDFRPENRTIVCDNEECAGN